MTKTYLFYDIETSGLNKCFDQVLQFAAIRTDLELNEIDRHEILVKLNPDVIPSPQAMVVHQITLEQLHQGNCEYEAISKIHQLFNIPGTITIGYNTLGFDDEFLRFSFYRNLLTPYTHQYANNCSRMDLYPMTVMYYLFKPEGISWPKIADKVSLKLEQLNSHNNLVDGRAHDAMTDVEATLALAKLLRRERKMWEYLHSFFDKKKDLDGLSKLSLASVEYQQALLIDGGCGANNFYQCPVMSLGMHNHYKNQSLWLRLDLEQLTTTVLENISETTFVYRKRFGEQPLLLPLTERFTKHLSAERQQVVVSNIAWLQKNREILAAIVHYYREYKYPVIPNIDVDAALYQIGFHKDHEQQLCELFHLADLEEKVKLIDRFMNPNLRAQVIRVLGRNYPEVLPKGYQEEFNDYLHQIKSGNLVVDYRNNFHLAPENVLEGIQQLQQPDKLSLLQQQLLEKLTRYIQSW